jgi:predicted HicB family RNase H-like nuclease
MEEKRYLLKMSEEQHKRAKVQAANEGITLNDLILKAIEKYLSKRGR